MDKTKWNYAVVRSMFGDIWVGKTKLPADNNKVFDNIEDASNNAIVWFEEMHPKFDTVDEDNNDGELNDQYEKFLYPPEEDEIEEIPQGVEKFII